MPRPRRARRAPAQTVKPSVPSTTLDAESASDIDEPRPAPAHVRGRKRTTRSTGSRLSLDDEKAILAAERSRDAAFDKLVGEDPTTTGINAPEDEDDESPASIEMGRRVPSPPAHRRDTTGLDLADDDVFGDLDDSFEGGDVPAGAQSTDVSSLNLSTFKRRPRTSSFIGRNDPPIRPSSRGGTTPSISSTLNLGVFRRRAREPSILGTARKPRPEETITLSSDPESSDEEDFAPDAESTPLNERRKTQPVQHASDSEFDSDTLQDITSKKSRKRKSEDALLSSDRPEKISRVEGREEPEEEEIEEESDIVRETPIEDVPSDSESSLSSLSSPSGPTPNLPERPVTPFQDEEIMAPPASSGSEDNFLPDIHGLAKRRRRPSVTTPVRAHDLSDISSPPSLTHSPNCDDTRRKRGRAAVRRQPSPKVTTADLTNMLPKRKYKKTRDEYDLESDEELDASGLGHDEDELSYLDTRTARRRKGSRPPSRGAARPGSRGGRGAQTALKLKQTAASARQTRKNNKTYSRRSSDKENEGEEHEDHSDEEHERSRFGPLPEDSFDSAAAESSTGPSADELRQAAKKFKEVDRWELEFEEITQSSSPPGAR